MSYDPNRAQQEAQRAAQQAQQRATQEAQRREVIRTGERIHRQQQPIIHGGSSRDTDVGCIVGIVMLLIFFLIVFVPWLIG